VGRLRHLYVRQDARRNGIGSALVRLILDEAKGAFQFVRLRTDTPEAAEFYAQLGFTSVNDATASHMKLLP
jgi:GNAT superfamily N-acetyltransferase